MCSWARSLNNHIRGEKQLGTYFDAVLDRTGFCIYSGTTRDVRSFLQAVTLSKTHAVCIGTTMRVVSIEEYLEKTKEKS